MYAGGESRPDSIPDIVRPSCADGVGVEVVQGPAKGIAFSAHVLLALRSGFIREVDGAVRRSIMPKITAV